MRLYFLCLYNLSSIQKAIQAGHAALEYAEKYRDTEDYQNFFYNHKTFILLDGGGSSEMKKHLKTLKKLNVNHAEFREPDLNNCVSAIAFLVREEEYISEEMRGYPIPDEGISKFIKQFHLAR